LTSRLVDPRRIKVAWRRGVRQRVEFVRPGYPTVRFDCSPLLVAMLFVFNAFDLALTQSQLARGNFREANVIAAAMVETPTQAAAYKTVLFGTGILVLMRFRKHRLSQAGLYGLTAFYAGMMVWWIEYLAAVEICLGDPARVTTVPLF